MPFLYHTKHIVLLLTSNRIIHNSCLKTSNIAYSSENTGILWPLDLNHDQCIGRTASHWGWEYHVLLLLPSAGNRSRTFCPCTGYRQLKTAPMKIHEELSVCSKVGSNFIIGACKGLHMRQRLRTSILQSLVCSRLKMIASCWLVSNRTRELVNHVDFSKALLTFRCFYFPFTTSSKNGKWLDDKWTWITLLENAYFSFFTLFYIFKYSCSFWINEVLKDACTIIIIHLQKYCLHYFGWSYHVTPQDIR